MEKRGEQALLRDVFLKRVHYLHSKRVLKEQEVYNLVRDFFKEFLDIDYEFTEKELEDELKRVYMDSSMREHVHSLLLDVFKIQYDEKPMSEEKLRNLLMEFRKIVLALVQDHRRESVLRKLMKRVFKPKIFEAPLHNDRESSAREGSTPSLPEDLKKIIELRIAQEESREEITPKQIKIVQDHHHSMSAFRPSTSWVEDVEKKVSEKESLFAKDEPVAIVTPKREPIIPELLSETLQLKTRKLYDLPAGETESLTKEVPALSSTAPPPVVKRKNAHKGKIVRAKKPVVAKNKVALAKKELPKKPVVVVKKVKTKKTTNKFLRKKSLQRTVTLDPQLEKTIASIMNVPLKAVAQVQDTPSVVHEDAQDVDQPAESSSGWGEETAPGGPSLSPPVTNDHMEELLEKIRTGISSLKKEALQIMYADLHDSYKNLTEAEKHVYYERVHAMFLAIQKK